MRNCLFNHLVQSFSWYYHDLPDGAGCYPVAEFETQPACCNDINLERTATPRAAGDSRPHRGDALAIKPSTRHMVPSVPGDANVITRICRKDVQLVSRVEVGSANLAQPPRVRDKGRKCVPAIHVCVRGAIHVKFSPVRTV